jgi:hypothetical protein
MMLIVHEAVLAAILRERQRQIREGHTPEADDAQGLLDFLACLATQTAKLYLSEVAAEPDLVKHCLVKVAAVAVAALESAERRRLAHKPAPNVGDVMPKC